MAKVTMGSVGMAPAAEKPPVEVIELAKPVIKEVESIIEIPKPVLKEVEHVVEIPKVKEVHLEITKPVYTVTRSEQVITKPVIKIEEYEEIVRKPVFNVQQELVVLHEFQEQLEISLGVAQSKVEEFNKIVAEKAEMDANIVKKIEDEASAIKTALICIGLFNMITLAILFLR